MKEHPVVYVLVSYSDGVVGVFYDKEEAIRRGKKYWTDQKEDIKYWSTEYYVEEHKVVR